MLIFLHLSKLGFSAVTDFLKTGDRKKEKSKEHIPFNKKTQKIMSILHKGQFNLRVLCGQLMHKFLYFPFSHKIQTEETWDIKRYKQQKGTEKNNND